MASSQALFLAVFISAIAFYSRSADAKACISTGVLSILGWGTTATIFNLFWIELQPCSGVQTKNAYLFGSIEMLIKLVPGNSAGTVTAYYLSSTGNKHDEIDFEFLGNSSGQPYIIHTNIFTLGIGNREQQFHPWFDPTADFHNYTIHWNPTAVVWYIDGLPIRVFKNYQSEGIPYPNEQGMKVYSSLWNADNWATRGGLVKINWKSAPFIARYRNFRARACTWYGSFSISQCASRTPANWYSSPTYSQLSYGKQGQMKWVRDNYMIYDYCKDTKRFHGQMPPECYCKNKLMYY
ncbi:unnamed protein product [Camellia sinensis]